MRKLLFVCLSLYVLAMMANAFNAVPVADDFCNVIYSHRFGELNYAIHLYKTWTGRFLTSAIISFFALVIPLTHLNLISMFLVLVFMLFTFKLSKLITQEKYFAFSLMSTALWLTYRNVLSRIVIWFTGGVVYILSYLLIPYFLSEFIKCYEGKKISARLIFFILILSNSIETVPPALIFFMASYTFLKGDFFKKEHFKYLFILSLIVTSFSIPLFLAPGNFARAQSVKAISFNFFNLFESYLNVALTFLDSSKNLNLVSILLGVISSIFLSQSSRSYRRVIGVSLIVSAIASGLPMGFAQGFNGSRPASLFVLLSSFGLFAMFSSIRISYPINKYKTHTAAIFIFITTLFVGSDFYRGLKLRDHFLNRDEELRLAGKMNQAEIVNVAPFKDKTPRSLNSHEISTDEKDWKNYCVAEFYKLKGVKVLSQ
ncbi:MAG: hypothetical protein K2P81_16390 [Bacteriovoracaceae bacterium]|nr:hypothetical protein [Bacteriovoracaceae bacterium]